MKEYLLAIRPQLIKKAKRKKQILGALSFLEIFFDLFAVSIGMAVLEGLNVVLVVIMVVCVLASMALKIIVSSALDINTMKSTMSDLFDYYPDGKPVPEINSETLFTIINECFFDNESGEKKIKEYAVQDLNNWKGCALLGVVIYAFIFAIAISVLLFVW